MNTIIKYFGLIAFLYLLSVNSKSSAINGMKKSKWIPLYDDDGNTNFLSSKNKSGVYLIKNGNEITYVGHSQSNLYRTMYRHFQSWKDKQYRVVYDKQGPRARVIFTTPSQAPKLEAALINKYKPVDNIHKMESLYDANERQVDNSLNEYLHAQEIPENEQF